MCLTMMVNSVFVVLCLECSCRSSTDDMTPIFFVHANLPLSGLPNLACLVGTGNAVTLSTGKFVELIKSAKLQNICMGYQNICMSYQKHLHGLPKHLYGLPKHLHGLPKHLHGLPTHLPGLPKHLHGLPKHMQVISFHVACV